MDLIQPDQQSSGILESPFNFNVVIPQPFSLSRHSDEDKNKIRDFIIEQNIRKCESQLTGFYNEYAEFADFWRVKKRRTGDKNLSMFNSRTGETHRAIETLSTFWYRVLTTQDPYIEAIAVGLGQDGREITSDDLYVVEQILIKQDVETDYKDKLLEALRSLATFGALVVEEPFISKPITGRKVMEATDFVISPLIKTFFDASRSRFEYSHYMANVDYINDFLLMDEVMNDAESYDMEKVKEIISNRGNTTSKNSIGAGDRIRERLSRAGYQEYSTDLHEKINYHGRLSRDIVDGNVIQDLWNSEGDKEQDPHHVDFTVRVLDGSAVISTYITQYGDWLTRFKTATFKKFENELLGYGVPKIGKKSQLEMDFMTSNVNNLITMALYNMWLTTPYTHLKSNNLGIKPLNIIEVEDVNNSLKPLSPDVNAALQGLNLLAQQKSEYRSTSGAGDTLQAIITKASATESSLAQNEAVRQQSVFAEIIGETLVRKHNETKHLNNINLLDSPIWVAWTGQDKPANAYNRHNLPLNVGIKMKITSDKDYRPQRLPNLLQGLQTYSSIRQMLQLKLGLNATKYLSQEIFRELGLDPRKLDVEPSIQNQLEMQIRVNQANGNNQGGAGGGMGGTFPANEVAGEMSSANSGGTAMEGTPLGDVPSSANMEGI